MEKYLPLKKFRSDANIIVAATEIIHKKVKTVSYYYKLIHCHIRPQKNHVLY
jgi:hypothetical protein